MSVEMIIFRLSPDQSAQFLGDGESTDRFLEQNLRQTTGFGLHVAAATGGIDVFDLGRMWTPMDFLLGELIGEPDRTPLTDGTGIGRDLGYGPALLHTSEQVQYLARALDPHTDISAAIAGDVFQKEIMPPGEWDALDEASKATFVETFYGLRLFVTDAAADGHLLLVVIY